MAHVVYSGQVTHLGLTTVDESVQFVPTGPGVFAEFGSSTWSAANGDQLFVTTTGTSTTTDGVHYTVAVHDVISGGTGRFTDATGSFDATVKTTIVSLDGAIATAEVDGSGAGQLSY